MEIHIIFDRQWTTVSCLYIKQFVTGILIGLIEMHHIKCGLDLLDSHSLSIIFYFSGEQWNLRHYQSLNIGIILYIYSVSL